MRSIQLDTMMPLFTIATITYNSSDWVRQSIESVLASSYQNFELIIADDNSSDNTWAIIQEYKDPRIKTWRHESNIGEYKNRNFVLNAAKGKYIFYIDGDDILYKNTLKMLYEISEHFPNAGMIWGVPDTYFHFAVLPFEFSFSQLLNLLYRTLIPIGITGLSETVFRIDKLLEVGGFSEEHGIGDYFIKVRLSIITSAVFVPRGLSFWRQNENQATVKVSKNYRSFIERVAIDNELLPLIKEVMDKDSFDIIHKNIRIKNIKLLVGNTLMKARVLDFFRLIQKVKPKLSDFKYLFIKGNYYYLPNNKKDEPLVNSFNFKK